MTQVGRTVLVTGASSGIGAAAARALAGRGHQVVASGRRTERLEALAAESDGISALSMDVTDASSVRDGFDRLHRDGRHIDVLVNCAGFAAIGPVEAIDSAEVRRQFDTNVFGLLEVTRAALPLMRARGAGRIVNISSVVGRTTFPGFGVYGASKYAVEALSDALRAEVRPFGIDVVVVEPGFVRSEINETEAASPDAAGGAYREFTRATRRYVVEQVDGGADPRELAKLLVRVVETPRPKTRYLFPASSRVLVGTFARIPDRLADAMKLRAAGVRT
jgi:NAD(P)-dependent dehydrogenase (short-subunit alcohol dehydrogenase family)